MTRRLCLIALASSALLLGACGGTDRPEGVVERWLISLNQGEAGQPEKYAPDELSNRILPEPREPNDLDVIEVGRGRELGVAAQVPYRVEVLDGPKLEGVAQLQRTAAGWRVTFLLPADPALRVPSEGGHRIGSASVALWLAGLGFAALLVGATWGLMMVFGKDLAPPPVEA